MVSLRKLPKSRIPGGRGVGGDKQNPRLSSWTTPQSQTFGERFQRTVLVQPWKGPGPETSLPSLCAVSPPSESRLIPGRRCLLEIDNVFRLHFESYLCFIFVPFFFF